MTPYTVRVLSLQANANHAYTESIVTYITILGFIGTALYGTRRIAYVSHRPSELISTTWEIIWLRFFL